MAFQYLDGTYKKEEEQLLTWASNDRTRKNDFKQNVIYQQCTSPNYMH